MKESIYNYFDTNHQTPTLWAARLDVKRASSWAQCYHKKSKVNARFSPTARCTIL